MKSKVKTTPDSIILGVSGEALLVLGLIIALADKPQYNGILALILAAVGLLLAIWSFALSKKRKSEGDGLLTIILLVMGILSFAIGILGYFEVMSLFVLGISAAVIGAASDVVLAIIAKKKIINEE